MDTRRSFTAVCALSVLACLVQVVAIGRAVVPAQDSVRYLAVAQEIAREGLTSTLVHQREQPLFPIFVWLCHDGLVAVGLIAASNWAICLQVAAAVPLVLAVAPVYLFFERLEGRAAVLGGVFFCLLPAVSRLGADGLSDSTQLCFSCWALWATSLYFSPPLAPLIGDDQRSARGHWTWLLVAGLLTGAALLARSEALVLPVATAATIILLEFRPRSRRGTGRSIAASCVPILGIVLVLGPYLWLSGALRPSAAIGRLMGRRGLKETVPFNVAAASGAAPIVAENEKWHWEGLGRLTFGRKDVSTSKRFQGYASALVELAKELGPTLHYAFGVLAVVGVWRTSRRADAVGRFALLFCGVTLAGALHLGAVCGYLSNRHLLLCTVPLLGWAAVGAESLGRALVAVVERRLASRVDGTSRRRIQVRIAASSVALLAILVCLPKTFAKLHVTRAAHREAADWLADHSRPSDAILDSRGWSALYTGRRTYRYDAAQAAFSDPRLAYVLVERDEIEMDSRRGMTLRLMMGQFGEAVARFPAGDAKAKHQVVVHRWHPERFLTMKEQLHAR